jgi:hypothetical protein|tara:strand:- start:290 stop:466 length:177 start_codon:yes stop_codon:yes gene_type:complete
MVYYMYQQSEELKAMDSLIIKQGEAIESQALYIKLLEIKCLQGYYPDVQDSPIYRNPL